MTDEIARFDMRVPVSFLKDVDRWRATKQPIPSRKDALVELTQIGLSADRKRKVSKDG